MTNKKLKEIKHDLFICILLDDAVGGSINTAPNVWAIANSELERIWKEVIVT
jgi:hypothetical protein